MCYIRFDKNIASSITKEGKSNIIKMKRLMKKNNLLICFTSNLN